MCEARQKAGFDAFEACGISCKLPAATHLKEKGRNHLIPALSFVVVATGFEPVTPAV